MKKKMKPIRFHLVILAVLIISAMGTTASASTVYLEGTSIANGKTVYWYPESNANGHKVVANTVVTLHFVLSSAESNVVYGLRNSSASTNTKFATFSGTKKSTTSKTITTTGYYKPYVINNTAGTIKVKGRSYISYEKAVDNSDELTRQRSFLWSFDVSDSSEESFSLHSLFERSGED